MIKGGHVEDEIDPSVFANQALQQGFQTGLLQLQGVLCPQARFFQLEAVEGKGNVAG